MYRMKNVMISALLLALAAVSTSAWGSPSLILTGQAGNYELIASGLEKVGAMDITIGYDKSTLSNPRVALGSRFSTSMMMPNLNTPGIIRVGIINAYGMSGSGTLLTLAINQAVDKPARFTSISATLHSPSGNIIPTQTAIQVADASSAVAGNSPFQSLDTITASASTPQPSGVSSTSVVSPAPVTAPPSSSSDATVSPVRPGTGSIQPTDTTDMTTPPEAPQPVTVEESLPGLPAQPTTEHETPPATATPASRKNIAYPSVLSRFREYKGPRTVAALTSLFIGTSYPGIHQKPAVALADGKTTVTIAIATSDAELISPKFSLKKAKLLSLKSDSSQYLLEVLPEIGSFDATVTVLDRGGNQVIPIISAPQLDIKLLPGGKLDEASLTSYLKQDSPRDLNGDGKVDYVDDYIAVANYLVTAARQ